MPYALPSGPPTSTPLPELADRVASELQLNKATIDALQLGHIDTFRFEEQALFSRCGELIRDGQYGRVMEITAQRAGSFWLTESIERQAQWEAIRLAAELGSAADAVDADLAKPPRTVEEWVDRYATSWHLLDRAQRHLEAWLPKLDDDPDEIAISAVRSRYDATLERIAVGFGKALQDADWDCSPVLQQTSVFQDFVKPTQGRVAYFLVDAMRYEMGADLAARLEGLGEVSIHPAISVLPSITTTGMAALMPGAAHSYDVVDDHGKLLARVDENPLPDLNARKKHFAARFPASIDFELGEMLPADPQESREEDREGGRRGRAVARHRQVQRGWWVSGSDRDEYGDRKHCAGRAQARRRRNPESCDRVGSRTHLRVAGEGRRDANRRAGRRHRRTSSALLDRARRDDTAGDGPGRRREARERQRSRLRVP